MSGVETIYGGEISLEAVKRRVKELYELSNADYVDDAKCHGLEDDLYFEFIQFVRSGDATREELSEMAEVLLQTENMHFSRWCE